MPNAVTALSFWLESFSKLLKKMRKAGRERCIKGCAVLRPWLGLGSNVTVGGCVEIDYNHGFR